MIEINKNEIEYLPQATYINRTYLSLIKKDLVQSLSLYKHNSSDSDMLVSFRQYGKLRNYLIKNKIDLSHNDSNEYSVVVAFPEREEKFINFTIQAIVQAVDDYSLKEYGRYKLK